MKKIMTPAKFKLTTLFLIAIILISGLGQPIFAQSKTNTSPKDVKKLKKWDNSYEVWEKGMKELNSQRANLEKQLKEYNDQLTKMNKTTSSLEVDYGDLGVTGQINSASGSNGTQSQLMQATQQMQETQMSFNMQYLQLQNSMQNENRQFTMVSNIMKTKHDTVKNTISNIH